MGQQLPLFLKRRVDTRPANKQTIDKKHKNADNFFRHARKRAKLYNIPETVILSLLKRTHFASGKHEIIKRVRGFIYPLKIVLFVEKDIITVITNYPLKKGLKK